MQPRQADACIPLQPPEQGRPHAAGPDGGPRDFILWSLFNALLGQGFSYLGCLCFPALIFSIKARDRKVLGDLEAARRYGARAKALNIISSLLLAGAMVAIIIIVVWR
ncbi:interferon-induced transmembrane protein 5-like [Apteryx rowi]|uniref:interferon-induced transmembrane protein 5-like n=1 Tax=Apteryx rowi TaxID=308060 RepID=UPI000E1DD6CE|nr:interferon-induced transmembrane protein 5-like [Apteryx rowi]